MKERENKVHQTGFSFLPRKEEEKKKKDQSQEEGQVIPPTGDKINALMAVAAFNFKKALKELKNALYFWLHYFFKIQAHNINILLVALNFEFLRDDYLIKV